MSHVGHASLILDLRNVPLLCSKGEVTNLLESAGFSRANPYYIVQQGKVRRLGTCHNSRWCRLCPCKREVLGTMIILHRCGIST